MAEGSHDAMTGIGTVRKTDFYFITSLEQIMVADGGGIMSLHSDRNVQVCNSFCLTISLISNSSSMEL
jgi:hypothetical protein